MRLRVKFEPKSSPPAKTATPQRPLGIDDPSVSPAARNLALAYRIDELIEKGLIADYTAAARLLNVSQVRITHLMSMLLLAPTIQEAILAGTIAPGDKQLRQLARVADWREQIDQLARLGPQLRRPSGSPRSPATHLPPAQPASPVPDPQQRGHDHD